MDAVSHIRNQYLNSLSTIESMRKPWPAWRAALEDVLSQHDEAAGLLPMGESLHDIFRSTGVGNRSQAVVSTGGTGWECLICWYLNLLFTGTPVLAMRANKQFVPEVLRDVLCVTIGNNQTNTESDILIFSVPDSTLLNSTYPKKVRTKQVDALESHLRQRLEKVRVINLQCKTNWNDNAQIPMLWDNIYNAKANMSNIRVGIKGVAPGSLESFRYAFVTVPTVDEKELQATSLAVLRVTNLTGGNYWGLPTTPSIAQNIGELPTQQFGHLIPGGITRHHQLLQKKSRSYIDHYMALQWPHESDTATKQSALSF